MPKPKPHKRHTQPRTNAPTDKQVVQQAIPRGGLLDQLQLMQAGLLPRQQGQYLDLTGYDDYQGALNFVVETRQRFDALPSGLRRACANDPQQFLRLVAQAAQGDEFAALTFKRHGLVVSEGRVATEPQKRSQAPQEPQQQDLVQQSEAKNAAV